MTHSATGWLYASDSAKRVRARLHIDRDAMAEFAPEDGSPSVRFGWHALSIPSRLADTTRTIKLPNGQLFETRDNDVIDAMLTAHNLHAGSRWLSRFELNRTAILASLFLIGALIVGFFQIGLPVFAERAARTMPDQAWSALGERTVQQFDKALFQPSALPGDERHRARMLFNRLVSHSDLPPDLVRFEIRKGGPRIGANAFALPGGTIVMTDELWKIAKSEDEVAGVLAHELGHVEERHPTQAMFRSAALGFALSYLIGDISTLAETLLVAPVTLLELRYTRDLEREADTYAIRIMLKAGVDPANLANILERMTKGCGALCDEAAWITTHPATSERIRKLRAAGHGRPSDI